MKIMRLLLLAGMGALAGCDSEGIVRPPPTDMRVFNAATNLEVIAFLREEDVISELDFGDGTVTSFDSGQYDFHLEHTQVGRGTPVRAVTVSANLSPDREYTFVAITPGGVPDVLQVSTPQWPGSQSMERVTVIHAFPGLGDLDVYVELLGVDPINGSVEGTVSFGSTPAVFEVAAETQQIYLTTAGDPTDIVFESVAQGFQAGNQDVLVVADPGGSSTLDVLVSRVAQVSGRLGQVNVPSSIRVVQTIDDRMDRDIFIDDTTMPPFLPAHPFGLLTDYADVSAILHTLITTPVGMPGTEESVRNFFGTSGRRFTALIGGDTTDGIFTQVISEDKRSISGQSTFTLLNGAGLFELLSFYLVLPGTDITTQGSNLDLFAPDFTLRIPVIPNDYEIWIEDPFTTTVLAGPLPVTMVDGGVYGILLLNGADGSTVDIQLFDDFVP